MSGEPIRVAVVPVPQRLVGYDDAAAYLGRVSPWSVRALVDRGWLTPIRLPSCRRNGESGRRLLFDVRDLDLLIDRLKQSSNGEPDAQLSGAALKGWERRRRREADRG